MFVKCSLVLCSSLSLFLCVRFFFLLGCSWTVPRNCPGLLSSVLHIKCGRPSAHWCAIFHTLAVQSGSVPALSFSVITHFGPDIVRKSRLFWQCEARKKIEKRGREREWNLCDCDSSRDSTAGLVKRQRQTGQADLASIVSHLSWNCLDGIRPARGLASPSCLACHQVASSWLIIWRMEPFLKASPASLHGMALSSLGS